GFSVFAGVGERTREGNDLYREKMESGVIKLGEGSCEDELQKTADCMGMCSSLGRNQYEKDCGNLPQKVSQNGWLQSRSENMGANNVQQTKEKKHRFPMKRILQMETGWYTSPEEAAGAPSSRDSDVYQLGVLFWRTSPYQVVYGQTQSTVSPAAGAWADSQSAMCCWIEESLDWVRNSL
ncbi:SPA1-related 4-like protein isoform X1, partial [Tanacetum coccineum]